MSELGFDSLSFSFGAAQLLDGASLQVEQGEHIGLLGRNGCGKSTLLKILGGELDPDGGTITRRNDLSVASLPQDVPRDISGTVRELLHAPLKGIDAHGSWENDERIDRIATKLRLDLDAELADQSAGTKRRALLARALVQEPDLLLLDEPTNHLDIEAVRSLEELLQRYRGAIIFVTHDRAFLRSLSTRIIDLDRGKLASYECDYEKFLERKEALLEAEATNDAEFDKKLKQEEAWLRRGVKARRTRNQGRVRALKALREERGARRDVTGKVNAELVEGRRSGQLVIRATGLNHSYDENVLLKDFSTEIRRGDRVGILGPNGCGKTTLLRILLEEIAPQGGELRHGTNLEIGIFDQLHNSLDDNKTVRENVCDFGDSVTIGDKQRHIISYLQDFLFTPDQVQGPITRLSGGERNRLQLAKLLARPCNILILDEPTNDLDMETLELLETLLLGFQGTLLIVSHDREFIDNVVTSTLVFEGNAKVGEYVGGYTDWLTRDARSATNEADQPKAKSRPKKEKPSTQKARRLTFKELHELKDLPERVEKLETEQAALLERMGKPEFFKRDSEKIAVDTKRLDVLETEVATTFARWETLETIAEESGQSVG
ncbi:MAG: ATP-binding cassette subfamily F protein uup [Planctomycetota bacterium]|jgi:ATP-binding cassette subfamily F protein uup